MKQLFRSLFLTASLALALSSSVFAGPPTPLPRDRDCYLAVHDRLLQLVLHPNEPLKVISDGTSVPIAKANESEGVLFSDISSFFRINRETSVQRMRDLLTTQDPKLRSAQRSLGAFFNNYVTEYKPKSVAMPHKIWDAFSDSEKIDFLAKSDDLSKVINADGRDYLFFNGSLKWDKDLILKDDAKKRFVSPEWQKLMKDEPAGWEERFLKDAPAWLRVTDDLGGYEINNLGTTDHAEYYRQRKVIEELLEGRVGQQHSVHGWPTDPAAREKMASQYIETLDTGTWFLYWRSILKGTRAEDGDGTKAQSAEKGNLHSIIDHQYLGVYTRPALDRLYRAVVNGVAGRIVRNEDGTPKIDKEGKIVYNKLFENKFRFLGARSMPSREGTPNEGAEMLPDWEMRAGNKGVKRDLIEAVIDGRISTGDFSGMKDFRSYEFDANTPIRELTKKYLSEDEIRSLENLQEKLPKLSFSEDKHALNHFRNKIMAPLLPWENRLNLEPKMEIYTRAQAKFAHDAAAIGKEFAKGLPKVKSDYELGVFRKKIFKKLQLATFEFEKKTRLDQDLERYLRPRPTSLPDINVKNSGPIDVNKIDTGIEFSFRFNTKTTSKKDAEAKIARAAEAFKVAMGGGSVEKVDVSGAHGHGIGVRYVFKDLQGRSWRFEWDGIARSYDEDGNPVRAHGGHMEVPSPKDAPIDYEEMALLYRTMREQGMEPKRSAGGAHNNIDLGPLMKLPPKVGARKVANLIATFETNRQMISAMWQHPSRARVALPVQLSQEFVDALNHFDGDWDDLATLLYKNKYFNPLETRKAKYMQMNTTSLLGEEVPKRLRGDIDIKNPKVEWHPVFGEAIADRLEFRLFDAMPDEYMAALQLKYMRALLNAAYNTPGTVPLTPLYDSHDPYRWREDPQLFAQKMWDHLTSLGLDPNEYSPIINDAIQTQQVKTRNRPLPAQSDDFPAARK